MFFFPRFVRLTDAFSLWTDPSPSLSDDALYQTFADTLEEAAKILRNAALATRPGAFPNAQLCVSGSPSWQCAHPARVAPHSARGPLPLIAVLFAVTSVARLPAGMKDNTKNLPAEGKSSTEDNANLIAIRKQCLESSKATQQILLDMGEMYQILCRHKQLKKKSGLSTFYMLEASTPVSYRGERAASSPAGSAVFGVGGGGEMPRTGSASQV